MSIENELARLENLGKPIEDSDIPMDPDSQKSWDNWQEAIKGKTQEEIEEMKQGWRQQIDNMKD